MRPSFSVLAAAVLSLSGPACAAAQQAPAPCPAPVAPAGELAPWAQARAMPAAHTAAELPQATLAIGQAARLALAPAAETAYVLPPERAAPPATFGGMVRFSVAQPGTYRVALGTAAWIDVVTGGGTVAGGGAVPSSAHGHGPACTGIRKIVDFALQPGDYTIQLSGSAAPEATLLVAAKP